MDFRESPLSAGFLCVWIVWATFSIICAEDVFFGTAASISALDSFEYGLLH
ncbi:hypothetical protein ACRRTK_005899 [Alexandromys fortis]